MLAKSHLRVVAPTNQNRSVATPRRPNAAVRTRECLTGAEVAKLIACRRLGYRGR
jgi:hypothetical protein